MNNFNIAILTTGYSRGSNFLAIYDYIKKNNLPIQVKYLFVTDDIAPIVSHAIDRGIDIITYNQSERLNDFLTKTCKDNPVDLIVLAGFMRKLSSSFFQNIKTPIINIHPALLPKYGGKGMFGMNVHKVVFEAGEKVSGATVHYVNENYDEGDIIMQKECDISMCQSPEDIAQKVIKVEHEVYPLAIHNLLYQNL